MFKKNKFQNLLICGTAGNIILLVSVIVISLYSISLIKNDFVSHHNYMEKSFNRLEFVKILFSVDIKMHDWQNYVKHYILTEDAKEKDKIKKEIIDFQDSINKDLKNYVSLINTHNINVNRELIKELKEEIKSFKQLNMEILKKSSFELDEQALLITKLSTNEHYLRAQRDLDLLINRHINNSINEQDLSLKFYNRSIDNIINASILIILMGIIIIALSVIKDYTGLKEIINNYNQLQEKEKELIQHNKKLQEHERMLKERNRALTKANEEKENANRELLIINKSLRDLDSMKNNFISTVSHELRTPLTSIKGSLGLILNDMIGPVNDETRNFLNVCYKNTDRLVRIINEILDIAKMESGQIDLNKGEFDFTKLINESIEGISGYAVEHDVQIINEVKDTVNIYADEGKISQVMYNLLSNAIKFSSLDKEQKGCVRVYLSRTENHIQLNIEDNGIGIPEDKASFVFEKFSQIDNSSTRCREGTGLGLAICKAIIEEHRGTIWADIKQKKGVTIRFTLASKEIQDQYEKARQMIK